MEPLIKTKPPGPNAVAVLKRDAEVISQSMARPYPLVLERAQTLICGTWTETGTSTSRPVLLL